MNCIFMIAQVAVEKSMVKQPQFPVDLLSDGGPFFFSQLQGSHTILSYFPASLLFLVFFNKHTSMAGPAGVGLETDKNMY